MPRVVFISKSPLPNPMAHGRAMTKVCEGFAKRGADVELWYPRQTDRALAAQDLFQYYDVPRVFRPRAIGRLPRLPATIRWRLDAIMNDPYAWGRFAAMFCRIRQADLHVTRSIELAYWLTRFGLPTVFEIHQPLTSAGGKLLSDIASRAALRGVVALTGFLRDHALSLDVPDEKVIVQPSGVDLERFCSTPPPSQCRRELGLPLDAPIVGYIGRFRMWDAIEQRQVEKGLRMLIAAFQSVGRIEGKAPFLVCVGGPGEAIPEYVQLADGLGLTTAQYTFLDRVPPEQVLTWIRACDVVTLPWSEGEDFGTESLSPLKLFEYMAARVPVVATDLPAFRERLRHGENAWLVQRGDVEGFAAALRALLTDDLLRQRLADRAYGEVQNYSWTERVSAICRLAGW